MVGYAVFTNRALAMQHYKSVHWTFNQTDSMAWKFEPPRDKTNKMTVRPAETQIRLGSARKYRFYGTLKTQLSLFNYLGNLLGKYSFTSL